MLLYVGRRHARAPTGSPPWPRCATTCAHRASSPTALRCAALHCTRTCGGAVVYAPQREPQGGSRSSLQGSLVSGPSGAMRLGLLQGSNTRRKSTSAPPEPKGTPSWYACSAPCEYPTSTLRVRTLFEPKGRAQPVRLFSTLRVPCEYPTSAYPVRAEGPRPAGTPYCVRRYRRLRSERLGSARLGCQRVQVGAYRLVLFARREARRGGRSAAHTGARCARSRRRCYEPVEAQVSR